MSLREKIDSDIKSAMLAQDKVKLLALRDIKKMIVIEATKGGTDGNLTEADEIKILQKAVKQRKESAEIYKQQNRPDLYDKEQAEIEIIEVYLPKAMDNDELEKIISQIIKDLGVNSPSEMGKVMGVATKTVAGRADGKAISEMVKKLLAN